MAVKAQLGRRTFLRRFQKAIGFTPAYLSADEFGRLIAGDDARLARVMADLGLKKQ